MAFRLLSLPFVDHAIKKGGKNRRRGKNENEDDKRELVFREDGQGMLIRVFVSQPVVTFLFLEYAQVLKMLGNGRLEAQCFDGEKRLAHIRGKMRKKVCPNHSFFSLNTNVHIGVD